MPQTTAIEDEAMQPLPLGTVCTDASGNTWVYIGYRTTKVGTNEHHFIRAVQPHYSTFNLLVSHYKATRRATIIRMFPSLDQA